MDGGFAGGGRARGTGRAPTTSYGSGSTLIASRRWTLVAVNFGLLVFALLISFLAPAYYFEAVVVLLGWLLVSFFVFRPTAVRRRPPPVPAGSPPDSAPLPSGGSTLSGLDFCVYCGRSLPSGAVACPSCGRAVAPI